MEREEREMDFSIFNPFFLGFPISLFLTKRTGISIFKVIKENQIYFLHLIRE